MVAVTSVTSPLARWRSTLARAMPQAAICEVRVLGRDAAGCAMWETAAVASAGLHNVELLRLPAFCSAMEIATLEFDGKQRRYLVSEIMPGGRARLEALADMP